jgi:BirA family transcriptional regulator, biotin operon repressor / biotin---[acetyl-CoA-carboxylase] ligase
LAIRIFLSTAANVSDVPDRDEIDSRWPAGWSVRHVAATGSTNADLLAAGAAGMPGRSVLVADHQAAGRGRHDRVWEAPAGANLLASLLLRDADLAGGPNAAVQRLSLAAIDACERVAGVTPALKWPNDLLVDGAKLAGVLAQSGDGFVVVGIGLNVRWAPPDAARLGDDIEPLDVLDAMLRAFDALPPDLTLPYRARLVTLGRKVRVELPGGRFLEGTAIDVRADGRLVIDAAGTEHVIDTGDIVHLRGA